MPLIVIEGIDGCGKSTQAERITQRLIAHGITPLRLREPGGTVLGERLRALLLDPSTDACPTAELFAYLAARAHLCRSVMAPALARGETILLDRFWYSTVAYQAFGLGLDPVRVRSAIDLALDGVRADVALWLKIDPLVAQQRRATARGSDDRIESRGLDYLLKVHAGYQSLANANELIAIDAQRDVDTITTTLWSHLQPLIAK